MSVIRLPQLGAEPDAPFPPVELALREPDGLLAFGGDLHPLRLINAYHAGIFPWYSDGEPILWWSPDPRTVFDTSALHLSRRFRRELRRSTWTVRFDSMFDDVMAACASAPRAGQRGTWITAEMRAAYGELHRLGVAHSVEVFDEDRLVGGLYGVAVGGVFCGESMFSAASGGSKVAIAGLCRRLSESGVALLDAQVDNPHLDTLGARPMARAAYLQALAESPASALPVGHWRQALAPLAACELGRGFPVPDRLTGPDATSVA